MIRSGLLPLPPPLPDELTSEDGDENKGLWNHKVVEMLKILSVGFRRELVKVRDLFCAKKP